MQRYFLFFGIVAIALLTLRFFLFYSSRPAYHDGQEVTFTTTLLSEPQVFSKYQVISAFLPSGEKVFITTSRFPEYSYGQKLKIVGIVKKRVLNDKQTILTISFPKIKVEEENKNFGLALTSAFRQNVIELFQQTLPKTSSSLLLGIVFGIKGGMPKDFKDNLQATGVLHVVAASGMNVTLVASFLSSILILFLRRQVAIVITLLGIVFYAMVSGLEASIVRASIMGSLAFTAQLFGRQNLALLGLLIAGYIMLFVSPTTLFDVGFQLSFAATLGLILISKIGGIRDIRVIGDDVNTTVSAQIATLPILLTTFGTYSLWSIIVNAILLWTVPILMVLGGVAAIFGVVSPLLGKIPLYLTLPFLLYFEKVVSIFADFGGMINFSDFPWQLVIGYYAILGAIITWLHSRIVR